MWCIWSWSQSYWWTCWSLWWVTLIRRLLRLATNGKDKYGDIIESLNAEGYESLKRSFEKNAKKCFGGLCIIIIEETWCTNHKYIEILSFSAIFQSMWFNHLGLSELLSWQTYISITRSVPFLQSEIQSDCCVFIVILWDYQLNSNSTFNVLELYIYGILPDSEQITHYLWLAAKRQRF